MEISLLYVTSGSESEKLVLGENNLEKINSIKLLNIALM